MSLGGGWARMRALGLPMVLVGVVAAAAGLGAAHTTLLDTVEGEATDIRFALRGPQPTSEIVVVAIDEDTFNELKPSWPLPRKYHAQMIDRLRRAGARQIVYDVQFTEESPHPAQDMRLYRAVTRAGHVVLATGESDGVGGTNVLGGEENLAGAGGARAGASNLPTDDGGVVRRYWRSVAGLDSIATVAAEMLGSRVPEQRFDADGEAFIDFRGGLGSFTTYSFSDVLQGRVPASRLRGMVVVVGASAATLQDRHATATSGSRLMAGPEIQAHAVWTAMHGNPLQRAPGWIEPLLIVLLAFAGPLVVLVGGPVRLLLLGPLFAVAHAATCVVLFVDGTVVPYADAAAALAAGTILAAGYSLVREARERRQAHRYGQELEGEVRRRTQELRETQLEVVTRLARAAELRDGDTGEHVDRMSRMCERVGLLLGMSEDQAELFRHASVLHDVGKIGTPDGVLHKPGALVPNEREVMERHTTKGADLLAGSRSPLLQLAETIARTHHERWDGTGYPAGLRGEEIPLEGRIAAACDVFDALTSERPYKRAWSEEEARALLVEEAGSHFDPRVVEALMRVLGVSDFELTAPPPRPDAVGPAAPARTADPGFVADVGVVAPSAPEPNFSPAA